MCKCSNISWPIIFLLSTQHCSYKFWMDILLQHFMSCSYWCWYCRWSLDSSMLLVTEESVHLECCVKDFRVYYWLLTMYWLLVPVDHAGIFLWEARDGLASAEAVRTKPSDWVHIILFDTLLPVIRYKYTIGYIYNGCQLFTICKFS